MARATMTPGHLAATLALAAAMALPMPALAASPAASPPASNDTGMPHQSMTHGGGAPGTAAKPPVPANPGAATSPTAIPGKSATGPGAAAPSSEPATPGAGMAGAGIAATKGVRASKIIGADVVNGKKETVGSVDDLIITPDEKVPTAVLSVGGFLGIGTRYVAVPFSDLHVTPKGIVMPGASKASLKKLPEFNYEGSHAKAK